MNQYNKKINEFGQKYDSDFKLICKDKNFNASKIFSKEANSDTNKYFQAVSETIIYYLFRNKLKVMFDYKINPPKDVDIAAFGNNFDFMIEIKTPDYLTPFDKKTDCFIHGELDHRYTDEVLSHSDADNSLKEITSLFNGLADIKPMRDNKLKDYLKSANEKMKPSDEKTINCLFMCCSTEEMIHMIDYLINEYTGWHTESFLIAREEYENIDFVIFSNCVESNLDSKLKFNIWDGSNYIYFILPNVDKRIPEMKFQVLQAIVNDQAKKYFYNRDNYVYCNSEKLDDTFGLHNFISAHFPMFCPNIDERKY